MAEHHHRYTYDRTSGIPFLFREYKCKCGKTKWVDEREEDED